MATAKISDRLFVQVLTNLASLYTKVSVGTGTQFFNDTDTELNDPVLIQSGLYGVGFDSVTVTGSNQINFSGFLESGEPVTQPVLIGEIGVVDSTGSLNNLGVGAKLNVQVTKDNTARFRIRGALGVGRIN